MVNNVANAKLTANKNSCSLSDVEMCEKGIQEISFVDESGFRTELKETYLGEAYLAYYYCNGCGTDWVINLMQKQDRAWQLVKEHIDEVSNT